MTHMLMMTMLLESSEQWQPEGGQ